MKDLIFSYYEKELAIGCCPDEIYAVMFQQGTNLALKQVSPSVWSLQTFAAASVGDFHILLTEHSERTRYYNYTISEAMYTIEEAETYDDLKHYNIEYWRMAGASPDRSLDTLLSVEEMFHDGVNWFSSSLGARQISDMSDIKCKSAVSFDSQLSLIKVTTFLERNGLLDVNVSSAELNLYDFDGVLIFSTTANSFIPNVDGVFSSQIPVSNIDPDTLLTLVVDVTSITDAKEYRSVNQVVTYD